MRREFGVIKLGVVLIVALLAIAGIAGAVMFRANSATDFDTAAAPVQGSSFEEPAKTMESAAANESAAEPTAPQPDAPKSDAPKHATAADIPVDIAKIPSATPVPRYEVVVNAAGGSPAPAAPAAAQAEPANAGDYKDLGFQVLAAYKYEEPVPREGAKPEEIEAERKKDQIPAEILALHGTKAMVEGWMVPMQVDDNGGVKTFVLVKTQPECCFGDTQKMNEWIDVTMPDGKTAEFNVDRPIKVFGQLEVGEKIEDGFVLSIYRMKADKVSG